MNLAQFLMGQEEKIKGFDWMMISTKDQRKSSQNHHNPMVLDRYRFYLSAEFGWSKSTRLVKYIQLSTYAQEIRVTGSAAHTSPPAPSAPTILAVCSGSGIVVTGTQEC